MSKPHMSDAESAPFVAVNIAPDFCEVDGTVVPFDIMQFLEPERASYAGSVFARTCKTLPLGSVIRGVLGDAGSGVVSGTSLAAGDVVIVEGDATINVEGRPASRHGHLCLMNGSG
ncbi:MAG: hypothetical protein AB7S26_12770 [Sandaracinaceae bacterium]